MSDEKPETKEDAAPQEQAPAPEIVEIPSAELAGLREKAAKADGNWDKFLRAKADFDNYQKRVARDRKDWSRQALEGFISELLPALDGMALAHFEDPKLVEAIRVLEKEFHRVLAKQGVVPIEVEGKTFDPQYHEAVGVEEGGTVLEEVRRGWMMNDFVLRPASVRIVKPAGAAPGKEAPEPGEAS